ncbi:alpha/beta hydrolase [Arthrobacter sp. PAMC25284]|uniref:alpha/beta hydrolase n=1 Tax=Arthrobacter sp. PAMC25284 TaxID=2861279 RepID=UPI0035BEB645
MIPEEVTMDWQTDILGDDYQACAFQAAGPDGIERTATLVRRIPDATGEQRPADGRAVLFLHGWSDYFFNVELAEFWAARGFDFFALDMHNHGRSLPHGTHGGYVADLSDYDAEITAAIGIIATLRPAGTAPPQLTLMGHSTGGLIAALWASIHPGDAAPAGSGQPVAGSAWQSCSAPCVQDHGGAVCPVVARIRHPAPGTGLLLAQHQQRGRGRVDAGRPVPATSCVPRPGRLAQRRPGRTVPGGPRVEHRCPDPGAHFRGQRQRNVLEGIHAQHRRGPGCEHDRGSCFEPGQDCDAGADRWGPARCFPLRTAGPRGRLQPACPLDPGLRPG